MTDDKKRFENMGNKNANNPGNTGNRNQDRNQGNVGRDDINRTGGEIARNDDDRDVTMGQDSDLNRQGGDSAGNTNLQNKEKKDREGGR